VTEEPMPAKSESSMKAEETVKEAQQVMEEIKSDIAENTENTNA